MYADILREWWLCVYWVCFSLYVASLSSFLPPWVWRRGPYLPGGYRHATGLTPRGQSLLGSHRRSREPTPEVVEAVGVLAVSSGGLSSRDRTHAKGPKPLGESSSVARTRAEGRGEAGVSGPRNVVLVMAH